MKHPQCGRLDLGTNAGQCFSLLLKWGQERVKLASPVKSYDLDTIAGMSILFSSRIITLTGNMINIHLA